MLKIKNLLLLNITYMCSSFLVFSQVTTKLPQQGIQHNAIANTIMITDSLNRLSLVIDYSKGCKISKLLMKGKNVLSPNGIYTGFRTNKDATSQISDKVKITRKGNGITIEGINFTDGLLSVSENWLFKLNGERIEWTINRGYNGETVLEETYFPRWNFLDLSVWKGGIIDNGGMVWCKYLPKTNDTYAVHTGGVTFWNPESGNALRIGAKTNGLEIASKFSHSEANEFVFSQSVTDTVLGQRYDLSRFVSGKPDVFAPFTINRKKVSLNLTLQYVDYDAEYSRGNLPGIDEKAVRELLNTTGRYGVVDNNIVGANGWLTNWKCLHEPFFAQIGLALNDPNYTSNLAATLDQERDLAMLPNGRVLSRWHNVPGDEMPGTYNSKTGYYEAQWGYTIDSQTGYVINTSEQFDLSGDRKWLMSHKESCEKALAWLIHRDSNNNGIFEMMNNEISEERASDWLDIVWAGYENAFVNAQMYEALNLWSECEKVLGDPQKAKYYAEVAKRLKLAFNKPIEDGGFWSEAKKQYVYWRDQDGSIHGDNLVTPVNFAAIAFGICDDPQRITEVLGQIEQRTTTEDLFHWPLCFDSFKRDEVHDNNWPFPRYENGDIFPTWGYLGIRAYTGYNKEIALKYIKKILEQYRKDGLSSQRYSRTTQLGLGNDILAGIATTITALYSDIYGIRPKWNRMGLEPNMLPALNNTKFPYTLRGTIYQLTLNVNRYEIKFDGFLVKSKSDIGVSQEDNQLVLYKDNKEERLFILSEASQKPIAVEIVNWSDESWFWQVEKPGKYTYTFTGLEPGTAYDFRSNDVNRIVNAGEDGILQMNIKIEKSTSFGLNKK